MFGFEIFDPSNTVIHHIVPISNKTSSLASLQRGTYAENGQEDGVHVYIYEPPAIELYTTYSRVLNKRTTLLFRTFCYFKREEAMLPFSFEFNLNKMS